MQRDSAYHSQLLTHGQVCADILGILDGLLLRLEEYPSVSCFLVLRRNGFDGFVAHAHDLHRIENAVHALQEMPFDDLGDDIADETLGRELISGS